MTKKIFGTLIVMTIMAATISSCSSIKMIEGHNVLTKELMEKPAFNDPARLAKLQWLTSKEIMLVRSYETATDTVVEGKYVTSIINTDTITIPQFTKGIFISDETDENKYDINIAVEDSSSYLKFTPKKRKPYALSVKNKKINYGNYEWIIISGGKSLLLFDLQSSEQTGSNKIVTGIEVTGEKPEAE